MCICNDLQLLSAENCIIRMTKQWKCHYRQQLLHVAVMWISFSRFDFFGKAFIACIIIEKI